MQEVRSRVISLDTMTTLFVNHGTEVTLQRSGELLHQVDSEVILTLGIKDFVLRAIGSDEEALITYLTTHLSIEGSLREDDLIEGSILLLHLTIAEDLRGTLEGIIADEAYSRAIIDDLPVTSIDSSGITCTLLLLLHSLVKAGFVDAQPLLSEDQCGQVKGEAVGIIEDEGIVPIKDGLTGLLRFLDLLIQETDTRLQRAQEALFLLTHHLSDELATSDELGVSIAHRLDEYGQEAVHKGLTTTEEGIAVADSTA